LLQGTLAKVIWEPCSQININTLTFQLIEIQRWTTATHLFDTGIRPSPVLLSANLTMTPFCSFPPINKDSRKVPVVRSVPCWSDPSESRFQLFWSHGLEYVLGYFWR
jgi:hypothetical protein